MSQKIAICADVHLSEGSDGTLRRLANGVSAMREIITKTADMGCSGLFIAGDRFHDRRSVAVRVLAEASTLFDLASSRGVRLGGIAGNHDLTMDGAHCSCAGLRWSAFVERSASVIDCCGYSIYAAPWSAWRNSEVKKTKCDIVIGHVGVQRARVGSMDFEMEDGDVSKEFIAEFEAPVVLGHYHKPQEFGTGNYYVGSVMQMDWGEEGEGKRMLIFDGSSLKSVPISSSGKYITTSDRSVAEKSRNCDYVRLVASDAEEARKLRKERAKGDLPDRVTVVSEPVDAPEGDVPAGLAHASSAKQLREWVKRNPPEGVKPKKMRRAGIRILGES